MPENVTRFQPPENVKKSLICWTHIDIMPSRLPTFFHEEPVLIIDVDREAPGAWKREPYYEQLKARAVTMQVQVNFRNRRFAIRPNKDVEFGPDEQEM